jgi:rare lipoprotein A
VATAAEDARSAAGGLLARAALALCALGLAACSGLEPRGILEPRDGPGDRVVAPESIVDAVPRAEPRSRYGNPESYEVNGRRYYTMRSAAGYRERGIASWYGSKFHGRRTSSGEPYDMYQMTAAHTRLPLPTFVEVRNLENGRTAIVRVNDRGPFHDNRVIDLSYAAALKLGVTARGTAFVEVRAVDGLQPPVTRMAGVSPHGAPVATPLPPAAVAMPVALETPDPVAPAPVSVARPMPVASVPAAAPGMYLQVGAFQDRQNAVHMSEQIGTVVAQGVHIREIVSQGRIFYRVQIGPIGSVELADAIVAGLEQLGIRQHHFVTN